MISTTEPLSELEQMLQEPGFGDPESIRQKLIAAGALPGEAFDSPLGPMFDTKYHRVQCQTTAPSGAVKRHEYTKSADVAFHADPTLKGYFKLFNLTDRPHRFAMCERAMDLTDRMPEKDWVSCLISTYIDAEIFDNDGGELWRDLLSLHKEQTRTHTADELEIVARARQTLYTSGYKRVDIYHGIEHDDDYTPMAWTFDRKVALKFARRFSSSNPRPVYCAQMDLDTLLAEAWFYTNDRGEQEVYIDGLDASETYYDISEELK